MLWSIDQPFSCTILCVIYRYQISVHHSDMNEYLLVMKGAPEKIIEICSTILLNDKEVIFEDRIRNDVNHALEKLCSYGERVLGFCDYRLSSFQFPKGFGSYTDEINVPLKGFRFVGKRNNLLKYFPFLNKKVFVWQCTENQLPFLISLSI